MNITIKKYLIFCFRQRRILRLMLHSFEKEVNEKQKGRLAYDIINYAVTRGTGFYTIPLIESYFLEIGRALPKYDFEEGEKDGVLHVMTQAYELGGHSRVVARWIACSEKNQRQSVILLEQKNIKIPTDIENAVNSHGGIIYNKWYDDISDRALYLREISSKYQYIILHVHPNDPTLIVAFGAQEFRTPIVMYNHADHSYWCGSSVVDIVANLRDNNFCEKYRNINKTYCLGIPFEFKKNVPCKKESSREKLGIPLDCKVILTTGSARKYTPIGNCEFCAIVEKITSKFDNVICYGIGIYDDVGNWNKFSSKHFIALGPIKYGEEYFDYINACDLYLNSFPIEGGTAIVDAVMCKKPVLSYCVLKTTLGNIVHGIETITSEKEFIRKAIYLLRNESFAKDFANKQYRMVEKYHGIESFKTRVKLLYKEVDSIGRHNVRNIKKTRTKIDDQCLMVTLWSRNFSAANHRCIESKFKCISLLKKLFYNVFDAIN